MMNKKYFIHVKIKSSGDFKETIKRVLRAEQIGNFNPLFCTYRGNKRCLVKSEIGDLSDPFRRTDEYSKTLYIEV